MVMPMMHMIFKMLEVIQIVVTFVHKNIKTVLHSHIYQIINFATFILIHYHQDKQDLIQLVANQIQIILAIYQLLLIQHLQPQNHHKNVIDNQIFTMVMLLMHLILKMLKRKYNNNNKQFKTNLTLILIVSLNVVIIVLKNIKIVLLFHI